MKYMLLIHQGTALDELERLVGGRAEGDLRRVQRDP